MSGNQPTTADSDMEGTTIQGGFKKLTVTPSHQPARKLALGSNLSRDSEEPGGLQTHRNQITNGYGFKPLSLWSFVVAGIEN